MQTRVSSCFLVPLSSGSAQAILLNALRQQGPSHQHTASFCGAIPIEREPGKTSEQRPAHDDERKCKSSQDRSGLEQHVCRLGLRSEQRPMSTRILARSSPVVLNFPVLTVRNGGVFRLTSVSRHWARNHPRTAIWTRTPGPPLRTPRCPPPGRNPGPRPGRPPARRRYWLSS